MNNRTQLPGFVILVIILLLSPLAGKSGGKETTPDGEITLFKTDITLKDGSSYSVILHPNRIDFAKYDSVTKKTGQYLGYVVVDIIDFDMKIINDTPVVLVLYNDGRIRSFNAATKTKAFSWAQFGILGEINPKSNEQFLKIAGDDLYILSNQALYVSRDNAKTWNPDTSGLNGLTISDVGTDSGQNVFIATNKGLFKQAPTGSTWNSVSSPYTQASRIFGSTDDVLYLANGAKLSTSTDNGKSWNTDTIGLHGAVPIKFCEDSAQNIYVITAQYSVQRIGNGLFKHSGSGWINIGKNFLIMNIDPTYVNIFNNIAGGSTLHLSTNFGAFISTDGGNTWLEDNKYHRAQNITGLAITSKGTRIMSSALGASVKSAGSSNWVRSFPAYGFITGQKIYVDKNDVIYTLGKIHGPNTYSLYPREVWKSNDEGKTWAADTDGIAMVRDRYYFVDENSNQYMGSGTNMSFIKRPGNSWKYDTIGLLKDKTFSAINAFGSDGQGYVYAAASTIGKSYIYRRQASSTSWQIDSAGWNPSFTGFAFTGDKDGNIYTGTTNGGVFKRSGGRWKQLNYPNSNLNGSSVFALATDKSGVLFAAFSNYSGSSYNGLGVYMTKDTGANWSIVGTDSFTFSQLIAAGDTVFGLTNYGGVYSFTQHSTGMIKEKDNDYAKKITLFPNPVDKILNISLTQAINEVIKIDIIDMQGRGVINYYFKENDENIHLNLSDLKPGIYFLLLNKKDGIQNETFMKE